MVTTGPVRRVLLCSGKVYYDLAAYREKHDITDVAIIRFERLYPLPPLTLPELLAPYGDVPVHWVQEEPENQGPWSFMALNLPAIINRPLVLNSRPSSSAPAVGSHQRHEVEQAALVEAAFS